MWDYFCYFFCCFFYYYYCYNHYYLSESVECVTKMISDELTTTPLGTETAQNHFSTKAERMLLVTNATEFLSVLCVCVHVYVCVLFVYVRVCNCYLASESREGIVYQITLWLAAEKSHLLTMYCCDTHICTNVKS